MRLKSILLELMLATWPDAYSRVAKWRVTRRSPLKLNKAEPVVKGPYVLVVDHDFPEADHDAGSRAIAFFVDSLLQLGYAVCFWAATSTPSEKGRGALQFKGISTFSKKETGDLETLLRATADWDFSIAVVVRPLIAAMHLSSIRRYVSGPCLYYGHDIHHMRLTEMRKMVKPRGWGKWQPLILRAIEQRLWLKADIVLYPSAEEVAHVNAMVASGDGRSKAEVFPLWLESLQANSVDLKNRRGLLFVGSYEHPPNIDSINWFLSDILPSLEKMCDVGCVTIVGSGMDAYRPVLTDGVKSHVSVQGWVDDAGLDGYYQLARVAIAPLRFGAGVKGKVLEAMGKGLPCVMTSIGAQGLHGIEASLPVSDVPLDFAKAVATLLKNDDAWKSASEGGRNFVMARDRKDLVLKKLTRLLAVCNPRS